MRNPYENERSDAYMERAERAYDKYVAECAKNGETPDEWDEWLENMD